MPFDGAFLSFMRRELAPQIIGARVDKVYQPARAVWVLLLRGRSFAGKLLLSAESAARVQLTEAEIENPASPPMQCMLLRKRLVGARLAGLRQPGLERLLYIDFETRNELGDPITLTIACELMGRGANLVLCEGDGRVIDAVRRTDATSAARVLLPGLPYQPPPPRGEEWLAKDPAALCRALPDCTGDELPKILLDTLPGLSPLLCRELAAALYQGQPPADPLTPARRAALADLLARLQKALAEGVCQPTMIVDPAGAPVDYAFFAPQQYGAAYPLRGYPSLSALLDAFYARRDQAAHAHAKTRSLQKTLSVAIARLSRTLHVRTLELEKAQNSDQLRKYGELLKANLAQVPPGASVCRLPDYYDPDCRLIDIPLSPALTPNQNAQKYFKEYRKRCTAAGLLEGLIAQTAGDLAYLESVQDALSRAVTDREIAALEEELAENGWLRRQTRAKGGKPKKPTEVPPYTFQSADGFTILAGRNPRQNDWLTLRQADGRDVWFHTKQLPGAHVIVKADGKEVPESTLTEAAVIAASLSKGAGDDRVAVDYCPVRRVKKPAGAAPGYVIYEQYRTAYVRPNPDLLAQTDKNGGKPV